VEHWILLLQWWTYNLAEKNTPRVIIRFCFRKKIIITIADKGVNPVVKVGEVAESCTNDATTLSGGNLFGYVEDI